MRAPTRQGLIVAALILGAAVGRSYAAEDARGAVPTPRPIRLVANEVIERRWRKLLARTSDTAERISVRGGLVGIGQYQPRGGADYGLAAPPRELFPRAGGGSSLNVDPITGRSYFTHTP